jgi:glycosyltransferase involved in cell wall biosynthesis
MEGVSRAEIALSVVVPVFNQAGSIVANVTVIRDRIAARVDGAIEVIVVSDGSIDRTDETLLESALPGVRVLHYDRNLGKGYAVKVGALEATGRWIGYVDADLDLDPAGLPELMAVAERDELDFAIGSKRHPDSEVTYPRSRRVASWLFQQLVWVLFQLNVRDTQVGLKVFRREVAEQVLPLLLVKRYAFDIELLAVGRAFGFSRVRELPVRLDYQFTGSGVRPAAVTIALADTLAIFYRLRILRTYQRKRALAGAYGWTRPSGYRPRVTLLTTDTALVARLDWSNLDVVVMEPSESFRAAAGRADSELLACVEPGATPSGNFVSATVPFLARPEVAAVVISKLAPAGGPLRERSAAAVRESRLGGGSLYFRFMPGNIRYVRDFPAASYVVRRERLLDLPDDMSADRVPEALVDRGDRVIYTPEAFLVVPTEPLFRPHLARAAAYGRDRGRAFARLGIKTLRYSTVIGMLLGAFFVLGWLPALFGYEIWPWVVAIIVYGAALVLAALFAALRFRSIAVGTLTIPGIVLTHLFYAVSFIRGMVGR